MPYDATPAKVFAMLADPAFREQVCADQEVVSAEVTITKKGGGMDVVVDQMQRTPVPAFARKVIGETTHAVQRETWSDHRQATLVIETPTMPATIKGTITIEPQGRGAVEVVELEVKSKVPLIGGKLEKLMGDLVGKAIESEQRTGTSWLAGTHA